MNVHHWISDLALAKTTTVVDQKREYLALQNSENQNAFLPEPKWNPKINLQVISKFPKPKIWGTVPASDCIIYIKHDNFFSALLGIFRLQTAQDSSLLQKNKENISSFQVPLSFLST